MDEPTVMYDFVEQRDGWGVNVRSIDEKMWEAVYTKDGVSETCLLPCTHRHYDRGAASCGSRSRRIPTSQKFVATFTSTRSSSMSDPISVDLAFRDTDRETIEDWTFFGRLPVAGEIVETGAGVYRVDQVHHRPPGQSNSRPVVILETSKVEK